jgi:alpha-ketoglutarate-dependent taurine dioxygenase
VDLLWEQGDVGLLDNKLVMHARRPWEGEAGARRVLASLVK